MNTEHSICIFNIKLQSELIWIAGYTFALHEKLEIWLLNQIGRLISGWNQYHFKLYTHSKTMSGMCHICFVNQ